MSGRHVLVARRTPEIAIAWDSAEYSAGAWGSPILTQNAGRYAAVVTQSSLRGLIESVLGDFRPGCDLSVSPRGLASLIARGDPSLLDIPAGIVVELLCPVRADDPAGLWTKLLVDPAGDRISFSSQNHFVASRIVQTLRATFTDADLANRNKLSCNSELWVRHSVSADFLCPDKVPPAPVPVVEEPQVAISREEKAEAKRRSAAVKMASHISVETQAANRRLAKEHAAAVRAELAGKPAGRRSK